MAIKYKLKARKNKTLTIFGFLFFDFLTTNCICFKCILFNSSDTFLRDNFFLCAFLGLNNFFFLSKKTKKCWEFSLLFYFVHYINLKFFFFFRLSLITLMISFCFLLNFSFSQYSVFVQPVVIGWTIIGTKIWAIL